MLSTAQRAENISVQFLEKGAKGDGDANNCSTVRIFPGDTES